MNRVRRGVVEVDSARLVRVKCRDGLDSEDGWVVASGREWVLLQSERDAGLDGWVAVRCGLIKRVVDAKPSVVPQALELNGEEPGGIDGLDLDRTARLLETAAAGGRLFGIVERLHNDLRVGRLRHVRGKKVTFEEIDSSGDWYPAPQRLRLGKVAKVALGGQYLDRLAAVSEHRLKAGQDPIAKPSG